MGSLLRVIGRKDAEIYGYDAFEEERNQKSESTQLVGFTRYLKDEEAGTT